MARSAAPPDPLDEFGLLLAARSGDDDGEPPHHGRARRKRRGVWPWVLGLLLVLLLAVGGAAWFAYATYPEQVKTLFGWSNDYSGAGTGEVEVEIEPGDIGSEVSTTLVAEGVTKTESAFTDLITATGAVLNPGIYRLKERMSAEAALTALQDPANLVQSEVTIPEGLTLVQILPLVAESTGVELADLEASAEDFTALGVPEGAPNLEGWVFPATYTFAPDTTSQQMLQQMVDRMAQALDEAGVAEEDREDVLTLAGLVQKESNGEDDAKVARVFLNRIRTGMLLQSDATVSYGAGGTTVVPTPAQYDDDNRYNTYLYEGLPAGPISSPGDAAIRASVNPAKGKWLYFVTVDLETGETKFTQSFAQHEKNAAQFQRWLAANPDYAK